MLNLGDAAADAWSRALLGAIALVGAMMDSCVSARAQDGSSGAAQSGSPAPPSTAAAPPTVNNADQPSISSSVPVLGDFKKALLDRGVNLQLNYIQDTFGNPTGGIQQGFDYFSVVYMVVDANLATLAGLDGASFRVNAYQLEGHSISAYNIMSISSISSIEGWPTTRLFELWLEQKLFDGMASVRFGQLTADNQFLVSEFGSGLYVNATFGWPNITKADLPGGGGPNYPLATPGVRLKVTPTDQISLLAAIFNGDPSGNGFTGNPEVHDPAGTNFRVKDPPLLMGEVQYAYNQDKASSGLAGTVKLGAWYHFGPFPDLHIGIDHQSLASPTSIAVGLPHNGDYGVYGVIDQMLWRKPGDDPKKGVGAFARISGSPSDRNLVDFYAEAGVNFMGIWDMRPDDVFGAAASFTKLSAPARAVDQDAAFFAGEALSIRNYELVVEVTYQAQIIPGWTIQPDFQYIFHPGGGVVDPVNPDAGRIHDAAVFGLRTMVSF